MSLRLTTFWITWAIVALSHAKESPSVPRLLGIVSLPGKRLAIVEIHHSLPHWLIGEVGDAFGDFTLHAIEPAESAVTLRVRGTNAPVVLRVPELPGMREAASLHLRSVPSDLLLELYQQLSGRTVLRGPGLPPNRVDLISDPRLDAQQAVAVLVETLSTNRVLVQPAGGLFAFAVRASELKTLDFIPAPGPVGNGPSNVIPRNMFQFFKGDLRQLLDVYGELADLTVLHGDDFAQRHVTVRNETPLTRAEGIWLTEALMQLPGISISHEGENLALVMPFSRTNRVERLATKPLLRDESAVPVTQLREASGSPEKFLKLYCEVAAKRVGSVDPAVIQVRFECQGMKSLTRREAIYALETVAALQGVVLVENAAGEVEMTTQRKQRDRAPSP
jgi:hypothetical protein